MTFKERLDVYEKLMRLDKPIGILLLLWPTLWGLWLSSFGYPHPAIAERHLQRWLGGKQHYLRV